LNVGRAARKRPKKKKKREATDLPKKFEFVLLRKTKLERLVTRIFRSNLA